MADLADIVNELNEESMAFNLNHRTRFDEESKKECEECGLDIPEQRRKLGNVTRCFECQTQFERLNRFK